ncbi:SRPBCC domain-containing protein [Kitasatospora sp. KL5]|uniref:SRPBCC domain-containing protein n=1 Tax=Kitasatospora sp. KL5 TaxID=3425125 RepID=UPI003D6F9E76
MEHEVVVPLPATAVRQTLQDRELLARCVPGLSTDAGSSRTPDGQIDGRLKVRVGSSTITYRGSLSLIPGREGVLTALAEGEEVRGSGEVTATVRVSVHEHPDGSVLRFAGDLSAEGRLAEFPDDALETAGRRLLDRLAESLTAEAGGGTAPAEPEEEAAEEAPAAEVVETTEVTEEPAAEEQVPAAEETAEPVVAAQAEEPAAEEQAPAAQTAEETAEPVVAAQAEEPAAEEQAPAAQTAEETAEPVVAAQAEEPAAEIEVPAEAEQVAEEQAPAAEETAEPVVAAEVEEPAAEAEQAEEPAETEEVAAEAPEEPAAETEEVAAEAPEEPAAEAEEGGEEEPEEGGEDEAGEDEDAGATVVYLDDHAVRDLDDDLSDLIAFSDEDEPLPAPDQEPAAFEYEPEPAMSGPVRRSIVGRSAEEVDHAPPHGRYAPTPPARSARARAASRWGGAEPKLLNGGAGERSAMPWVIGGGVALLGGAVVLVRALRRR